MWQSRRACLLAAFCRARALGCVVSPLAPPSAAAHARLAKAAIRPGRKLAGAPGGASFSCPHARFCRGLRRPTVKARLALDAALRCSAGKTRIYARCRHGLIGLATAGCPATTLTAYPSPLPMRLPAIIRRAASGPAPHHYSTDNKEGAAWRFMRCGANDLCENERGHMFV